MRDASRRSDDRFDLCFIIMTPEKFRLGIEGYARINLLPKISARFGTRTTDARALHDFVHDGLPTEHVANLRRRDMADSFLANECKSKSQWGACGVLFTDKYDTSATLKALSFRYRGRVRFHPFFFRMETVVCTVPVFEHSRFLKVPLSCKCRPEKTISIPSSHSLVLFSLCVIAYSV